MSDVQQSNTKCHTLALYSAEQHGSEQCESPYASYSPYGEYLECALPQIISALHSLVHSEDCTTSRFQEHLVETGRHVGFFHAEVEDRLPGLASRLTDTLRRWLPIDEQLGEKVTGLSDDYIVSSRHSLSTAIRSDVEQLGQVRDIFLGLTLPETELRERTTLLLNEHPDFAKLPSQRKSLVSARLLGSDSVAAMHLESIVNEVRNTTYQEPGKIGVFSIEAIHQTLGRIARSMESSLWGRCRRYWQL